MTSPLPPLIQAVSGALGSAAANSIVYPLDLVTTRVQLVPPEKFKQGKLLGWTVLRRILDKHGADALYDGIGADTSATMLSNFLYYYCYTFLRKTFPPSKSRANFPSAVIFFEVALGFLAGVASRAITTPLNVVTFRLQTERETEEDAAKVAKSRGIIGILKSLYAEEGILGFYRGFSSTVLLSLNPGITLALFQVFRRAIALLQRKPAGNQVTPSPLQAFIGAALCNAIATTLLYPLMLSKTLAQSPSTQYSSLLQTLKSKRARSYQGLHMQLLKGCLSQGVTLMVKGRIEQLIIRAYMRK